MIFRPELAEMVMAGTKTVTRRPCSDNTRSPWAAKGCKLVVGRDYAVQPGRGIPAIGRVVVTSVRCEPVGLIDGDDARREGFDTLEEFNLVWQALYREWDPGQMVWRVEFGCARPSAAETRATDPGPKAQSSETEGSAGSPGVPEGGKT